MSKETKTLKALSDQDQLDATRLDYERYYARVILPQIDRNVNWAMRIILHRLCWKTWLAARNVKACGL